MAVGLYLQMGSGGFTSVNFADGSGIVSTPTYLATHVDLGYAQPSTTAMPTRGSYMPVPCSITFNVYAQTANGCFAALDNLYKLMAMASQWYAGYPVAPAVYVYYSPPGSTVTIPSNPLVAVVLRPIGAGVDVPNIRPMMSSTGRWVLEGVRIMFERQGEWMYPFLKGNTTDYIQGTPGATNTTIQALSFAAVTPTEVPMPAGVALSTSTNTVAYSGLIAIAHQSINLRINNFSYSGGSYTTPNVAAELPRSGSTVTRFTPVNTNAETTPSGGGTLTNQDRVIFVLHVWNRFTASNQTYRVRLILSPSIQAQVVYTQWRVVGTGTVGPTHIVFPAVGLHYAETYTIRVECAAAATGGALDINYVAALDVGNPGSQLFRFGTAYQQMVIRSPLISDHMTLQAWEGGYMDETTTMSRDVSTRALRIFSAAEPVCYNNVVHMVAMVNTSTRWAQATGSGTLDSIRYIIMRRRITITPR